MARPRWQIIIWHSILLCSLRYCGFVLCFLLMRALDQNDPVMMGLLKSTMFPLQQVLEGDNSLKMRMITSFHLPKVLDPFSILEMMISASHDIFSKIRTELNS